MTFRTLEFWFLCLAIAFFTGNPINVFLFGGTGSQIVLDVQGSFLEPAINMGIYVISFLLMLPRWRKVLTHITRGNIVVWIVVLLVVASTLWSDYPQFTLRRSIIVLGATIFGTYFATCFNFKQQIQALIWAFCAVAFMSLMLGAFVPRFGTMTQPPHTGSWRGVYMHKQGLGNQMALCGSFFLALFNNDLFKQQKKLIIFGLISSIFLVAASRSSTGLISFAVLAFVIYVCQSRKFGFGVMSFIVLFFSAFGLSAIAFYILDNLETVFGWFGKDMTVSGRDELFPVVWELIHQRPWLGYGYEAFWQGQYSHAGTVWQAIGWPAPHAHNGLLELLIAFGWIGTSIFLWTLGVNFVRSLYLIRIDKTSEYILPFLFLLQMVLSNMTERNLLGSGVTWILYVWVAFMPCYSRNQITLKAIKQLYQSKQTQPY